MIRIKKLPEQLFPYFVALLVVLIISRVFQVVCEPDRIFRTEIQAIYHVKGFLMDFLLALLISALGFLLALPWLFFRRQPSLVLFHVAAVCGILMNYVLIVYFVKTQQLLGNVFYQLTGEELITSSSPSNNLTFLSVSFPVLLVISYFVSGYFLSKVRIGKVVRITFTALLLVSVALYPWKVIASRDYVGDMVINNKLLAFIGMSETHFFGENELDHVTTAIFKDLDDSFFPDPRTRSNEYPLIHELKPESALDPYLNQSPDGPPNVVIIIVESLSSFLVGENKNNPCHFMPFLDSLSRKSLYFPNFLSTCERTHHVLPAILISAPNPPERAFMQKEELPRHWSLTSLLDSYYSRFYCGVNLRFANMHSFMEYNQTDYLVHSWEPQFSTVRDKVPGFWGYADDQLFEKSLVDDQKHAGKSPKLDIFLTISTHEPFCYPHKKKYLKRLHKLLNRSTCTTEQRAEIKRLAEVYGSYLFTDDALKNYFRKAAKKKDYQNTLFFILGDHGNPLFPRNEIQKYQTPLLIFSPLLKKTGKFNVVNSHNDLAPTLLNYLRIHYPELNLPSQVPFFGQELSFEKPFSCKRTLPLITLDSETKHLVYGTYYRYEGQLFTFNEQLDLTPSNNEALNNKLSKQLLAFRKLAQYYHDYDKLLPREQFREYARKGKKITLRNEPATSIVQEQTQEKFIEIAPKIRIKKGWKSIEVELNCELFIRDRSELEELPHLDFALERLHPKTMVQWVDHGPKLQNPLKLNRWNRVTYSFFLDVRKYSSSEQTYELTYYLLNQKNRKIKLRNSMVQSLVWY